MEVHHPHVPALRHVRARVFRLRSSGEDQWNAQFYRDSLIPLYRYQANLERGLSLLSRGDRTGYLEISSYCWFSDYMWTRGFEYGAFLDEVGCRRPVAFGVDRSTGIFRWAERATAMATSIWWTLRAQRSIGRVFVPPDGRPNLFPDRLPVLIRTRLVDVIAGDAEVPVLPRRGDPREAYQLRAITAVVPGRNATAALPIHDPLLRSRIASPQAHR
jgi:hypothetical protein